MKIPFNYNFHPVGQGLFATGMIGHPNSTKAEDILFNWVYDCGSSDSPSELIHEIQQHIHGLKKRKCIDCFIISHLDKDHINGVAELMKHVKVENLILPYVPLINRLEIMLRSPAPSAEDLRLAIDPSGYLQQLGGENLQNILYVVGDEGNGPASPPETDEPPFIDPEGREGLWLDFRKVDTRPNNFDRGLSLTGTEPHDYFITSNNSVSAGGLWEFVFYNQNYPEADYAFKDAVYQRIKQSHKPNRNFDDPDTLIADLKDLYKTQFPTPTKSNNISLVTYSGPIEQSWIQQKRCSGGYIYPAIPHHRFAPFRFRFPRPYITSENTDKASILYFGDITLTQTHLDAIINKFGRRRWKSVHPVQIAHHGAAASHKIKDVSEFRHIDSVYSYGLHNTYTHPGKDVVKDFGKMSSTLLANEHQGAVWFGNLYLKTDKSNQSTEQNIPDIEALAKKVDFQIYL